MSEQTIHQTVTIDSTPISALFGGARLFVGIEDDPDGSLKVFVDTRYKGVHFHVAPGEAQDQFRHAWGFTMSHLWLRGIDPDVLCGCSPAAVEVAPDDPNQPEESAT